MNRLRSGNEPVSRAVNGPLINPDSAYIEYPMLWKGKDRDIEFFAIELSLFVGTILQMVYHLGAERSITFSFPLSHELTKAVA